jgi:hypothetical protein
MQEERRTVDVVIVFFPSLLPRVVAAPLARASDGSVLPDPFLPNLT